MPKTNLFSTDLSTWLSASNPLYGTRTLAANLVTYTQNQFPSLNFPLPVDRVTVAGVDQVPLKALNNGGSYKYAMTVDIAASGVGNRGHHLRIGVTPGFAPYPSSYTTSVMRPLTSQTPDGVERTYTGTGELDLPFSSTPYYLNATLVADIKDVYVNDQANDVRASFSDAKFEVWHEIAPSLTFNHTNAYAGTATPFDATATTHAHQDTTFAWDFGDGTTSAAAVGNKTPSHIYAVDGTYLVTLTVNDPYYLDGPQTLTKTVVIGDPIATPQFTSTVDAEDPLIRHFQITNVDSRFTYTWGFGDGGTATGTSVTRTYANGGSYLVTVTMSATPPRSSSQTIIVTALPPAYDVPGDVLRLQYAGPVAKANRLENPSGVGGAWGWVAPLTGAVMTSESTAATGNVLAIKYTTVANAGGNTFYSTPFRVDAGQYLSVYWNSYAGSPHRVRFRYLNASGAEQSTSAWSTVLTPSVSGGTGHPTSTFALNAPGGTVWAVLEFEATTGAGAAVTTAGTVVAIRDVHVTTNAASTALTAADFNEGFAWVDFIGSSNNIKVTREGLDLGLLTAQVLDSSLDPARYPDLKKGVAVRLQANNGNGYQNLFRGFIDNATVKYNPLAKDARKKARISLTALDPLTRMANTPEYRGVGLTDLPAIFEGVGVPWKVNGNIGHVGSYTLVSQNDRASVVDQIAVARDSAQAEAFLDRNGVMQVRSGAFIPTDPVATLAEPQYSDIDLSFNPRTLINYVLIKWLHFDGAETTEVDYGPYEDVDSQLDNGIAPATFTMQGLGETEASVSAIAADILASNAEARVLANSVLLPIRSASDLSLVTLDIYDKVTVVNDGAEYGEVVKISKIEHSITPRNWNITVQFDDFGAVARPTAVPSVPTSSSSGGGGVETDPLAIHKSLVNAKGDLLVATAADTVTNLPVGSDGQVLTAASGQPYGVQWAAAAPGVPVGTVIMHAGEYGPSGYLQCDGSEVDQAAYPALYAIVGTRYGTASSGKFRLPSMRFRFPRAVLSTDTPGSGGSTAHTLTEANLPPHAHAIDHDHASFNTASGGTHDHSIATTSSATGSNTARVARGTTTNSGDLTAPITTTGSAHAHAIDVPAYTGSSGNGAGTSTPVDHTPLYVDLTFWIKVV